MKPAGNPWVPANPMGTGLCKISNPSWVRVFLMGIDIFHGYGFGTAKPSGFVPVDISMRVCPGASRPWHWHIYKFIEYKRTRSYKVLAFYVPNEHVYSWSNPYSYIT